MILLIILLCSCYTPSIHGKKLHEYMTKRQIRSVFAVDHSEIDKLEYEVVPIFHKHDGSLRGKRQVQFKAFHNQYSMSLQSNDVLLGSNTLVYETLPKSNANDPVTFKSQTFESILKNHQLYQDLEKGAAVTMYTDNNNNINVQGTIGHNIVVRSLPSQIHNEILNKYRDTYVAHEPTADFSANQSLHHVIIKRDAPSDVPFLEFFQKQNQYTTQQINAQIEKINKILFDKNLIINHVASPTKDEIVEKVNSLNSQILQADQTTLDAVPPEIQQLTNEVGFTIRKLTNFSSKRRRLQQRKLQPSSESEDTRYLEVMIAVDDLTYALHGSSIENMVLYTAAFWNGVDLRFRDFKNPKIRINIAGLVIHTVEGTVPYLEEHLTGSCNANGELNAVDTIPVLADADQFFYTNFFENNSTQYDLVFVLTKRKLCNVNSEAGGVFYHGSICQHYRRLNNDNDDGTAITPPVGLFEDAGDFGGVLGVAHEIGHGLNSRHDHISDYVGFEDVYPDLLQYTQTGGKCAQERGYIMSIPLAITNEFYFSDCSKRWIQDFLKTDAANCLKNKPDVGTPLPRILPDKVRSREQQCQHHLQKSAYTAEHIPKDNPDLLSFLEKQYGNLEDLANDCLVVHCASNTLWYNDENGDHYYWAPEGVSAWAPPPDGSPCGVNKACLDGECVPQTETNNDE